MVLKIDDGYLLTILDRLQNTVIFFNTNKELNEIKDILCGECGISENYLDYYDIAEYDDYIKQPIPHSDRWVYLVKYSLKEEVYDKIIDKNIIFFGG